jgi:hypothetical protein
MCDRVLYPALCEVQGTRRRRAEGPAAARLLLRARDARPRLPRLGQQLLARLRRHRRAQRRPRRRFLAKYVNVEKFPLWRHKTIRAAEMAKLLENSYRATTSPSSRSGRARRGASASTCSTSSARSALRKGTHDNMMLPGLGVGGYCLTKDALLAAFGAEQLLGSTPTCPSRAARS